MTRKRQRPTFADIVDHERRHPRPTRPTRPTRPLRPDDSPGWREVEIVQEDISAERAQELVRAGAAVGWDDCGSREYQDVLTWLDDDETRQLAQAGPPHVYRGGALLECRWPDGRPAVIVEMDVRWGRLL